jgi:hypothetical protein
MQKKLFCLIDCLENVYATVCELLKNPQSTFNLFVAAATSTIVLNSSHNDQDNESTSSSSSSASLLHHAHLSGREEEEGGSSSDDGSTPTLLIELLHALSSLNELLNRTSAVSVLDTINTYTKVIYSLNSFII